MVGTNLRYFIALLKYFVASKFSLSKDIIQSEENISVCFCHPRKKYPRINSNFPFDITLRPKMKIFCYISLFSLSVLYKPIQATGTITVTATPYEALPFPEGFKCEEKGVFPHRVHCNKYWLCQTDDSGENLKAAELYHCPEGYLFDKTISFCNNAEDVKCSTLGKEKLAKALDIMEETQRLEKKLKEIESTLKNIPKENTELDTISFESSNSENFVAESSDSLISLIL